MEAFEQLLAVHGDRRLGFETVGRLWDECVRENRARAVEDSESPTFAAGDATSSPHGPSPRV